jgi:hypothetical protein
VWIQSDIAALTTSRDAVVRAVEDFSSRCGLPVMLIGRNVLRRARFTHQVVLGEIDFESNLRLLETAPTSIGVAPLETMADEQTLDFVAGKSDLKILLFAGYGHPAVVSASPPYTESPFHDAAYIAGNSYGEWSDALEFQYREGWKSIGDHARRIQRARHLDAVVKESWAPALASVVMPQPISGAELRGAFLAFGERRRLASRESTAEPDPSPAMADALQAEIAALRNSLSWKITAPLRAIARPLMKKR